MSTQNPGHWPDAARPGYPQNPEHDGWHFLQHPEDLRPVPTPWDAAHAAWCSGGMHSPQGVIELGYHYVGPCLTPAEVAARVEAAVQAERVAQAEALIVTEEARIEADAPALAALVAAARRQGIEMAAKVAREIASELSPNGRAFENGYANGALDAERAIRALMDAGR